MPGIALTAGGLLFTIISTVMWAVPASEGDSVMSNASGGFLMGFGVSSLTVGAVLIGVGAKKRVLANEIWHENSDKRMRPPPIECSPAHAAGTLEVGAGRIESLRSISKGLSVPAAVLLGVGTLFGVIDVAVALDDGTGWSDLPVRALFTVSMIFGGLGIALLGAALGVRSKARNLYYGDVSALPAFSVGMVPGGGALASATWRF